MRKHGCRHGRGRLDGDFRSGRRNVAGDRAHHRILPLRFEQVLVLGGTGAPESTGGRRSVIAYDPALDTGTKAAGPNAGRSGLGVVEPAGNRVLVAVGVAATGAVAGSPDAAASARTGEVLIP
ncbi:hypothetical protein ACFWPQ_28545 [Streptomyces sp. NPDC058464]|uniref:hypothetical protein n=1 Tax=Streptomyces sp. NPDC058464 TaxID=3346511 RepID=UPI003653F1B1